MRCTSSTLGTTPEAGLLPGFFSFHHLSYDEDSHQSCQRAHNGHHTFSWAAEVGECDTAANCRHGNDKRGNQAPLGKTDQPVCSASSCERLPFGESNDTLGQPRDHAIEFS